MADSRDALLAFIVLGAGAVGTVVGGFWLAVYWMRSLDKKVGYSLAPLGFSRPRGGFLVGIGAGMSVGVGAVLLGMIVNPLSILVLERLGVLLSTRSFGQEHSERSPSKMIFIASALASSLLFALLHLEPVLLPVLLILAITLCALFQRTGSLLPSFVAHATFNSFAAALIILSGLNVLNIPI